MPVPTVNTHNMYLNTGRYKNAPILYTRAPISYLKWMVCVNHAASRFAQAELDRRGITTPTLDVTIHAVDRASEFAIEDWRSTRSHGEGFYSWLIHQAELAFKEGTPHKEKTIWNGVGWVFDTSGEWPVLKTVIPWRKT